MVEFDGIMPEIWTKDSKLECNAQLSKSHYTIAYLHKSGLYETVHLMGAADYRTTSNYRYHEKQFHIKDTQTYSTL